MLRLASQVTLLVALCAAAGCAAIPSKTTTLTDAASDMNVASRFGRIDVAASYATSELRPRLLESRREWGTTVRIVDVAMADMRVSQDTPEAVVLVDYVWTRDSEMTVRSTRVEQRWHHKPDGNWELTDENRVGGDVGLLGEKVEVIEPPRPQKQFETIVIR